MVNNMKMVFYPLVLQNHPSKCIRSFLVFRYSGARGMPDRITCGNQKRFRKESGLGGMEKGGF